VQLIARWMVAWLTRRGVCDPLGARSWILGYCFGPETALAASSDAHDTVEKSIPQGKDPPGTNEEQRTTPPANHQGVIPLVSKLKAFRNRVLARPHRVEYLSARQTVVLTLAPKRCLP
jgi:hypothetical protein